MDHSFVDILKTVGRGPKLSRPLDRQEARDAMTMILDGTVDPAQLGAFFLLLRYRRETPEELAGMIDAVHERLPREMMSCAPDLDWPSYADRHRQQPWFVLAALLLAQNGARILMHGLDGAQDGFAPTRPALDQLGVPRIESPGQLEDAFRQSNLVYAGVEIFAPELANLFALRAKLGVRTAVNTLARAINPARAPVQLQGVFHPNYRDVHRQIAALREQAVAAVFKGGGGEIQRNPDKPCSVVWQRHGAGAEETWPAAGTGQTFDWRAEDLAPERIAAVWRGELRHPSAEAAIVATAAIAVRALGWAETQDSASNLAMRLWRERSIEPQSVARAVARA